MDHRIAGAAALALVVLSGPVVAADRWSGTSNAQDEASCRVITFDISIDATTISGRATSQDRAGDVVWHARGRRDGASVAFDITRGGADDARMQRIRWIGQIKGDQMQLTQSDRSVSCRTQRTAVLRRS
jgi:hypothetical protein